MDYNSSSFCTSFIDVNDTTYSLTADEKVSFSLLRRKTLSLQCTSEILETAFVI